MKAMLAALISVLAICGGAVAQDDPDQSFIPGAPAAGVQPLPPPSPGHDFQPPQTEQLLADVGNVAACGVTDTSAMNLSVTARVTRVDIWYHWAPGESSVGYTLSGGGRSFTSGVLSRAECDPYQTAWCAARGAPNITLAPGRYDFRLGRASVCQNAGSSGAGFIKAWGYGR